MQSRDVWSKRGRLVTFAVLFPTVVWAQGHLENPAPGSRQSGIGLISGWYCTASKIEAVIDGRISAQVSYGTPRGDTQSVCGDTNNGFGLLLNWNDVGDGEHTIRMLADGQQFAQATFTVSTFGTSFLRGESATYRVPQFPNASTDTILTWEEGLQNFMVTGTVPTQSSTVPYNGQWHGSADPTISVALSGVTCAGADLSILIASPTFSGSLVTNSGIRLTFSGVASTEGVLGGTVRRDGSYFAVFTGSVSGNRLAGRWTDIFGCWGDFTLGRE